MPSILSNYEYDIFISYRQKDNRSDQWVTNFVQALREELDATFKEDISIYFDENPHDGLLETHDVDQSLNEKIKSLIFIPIISHTYCDPSCFAWQKEFIAFRDFAKSDVFGLDVKLVGGNVAKRILPVRIHKIDETDKQLFEKEIGGVIRSVDFIFKSSGVNRPLRIKEDHPNDNLYKTFYRDQINKVANAIKEIVVGIKGNQSGENQIEKETAKPDKGPVSSNNRFKINWKALVVVASLAMVLVFTYLFFQYQVADNNSETQLSIAVLPFSNTKPDPETDYLGFAIANQIIGDLIYLNSITVRPSGSIRKYEKQVIDPIIVGEDLRVDYVLIGNYLMEANIIRLDVELIKANSNEMIWREPIEVDFHNAFELQDIVAQKVVEGLDIQFSQDELNVIRRDIPNNPLAYEYYLRSISYPLSIEGYQLAIEMLEKSIELDSNYAPAYDELGMRIKLLANQGGLRDPEENIMAEDYFIKALSLNGELLSALGNLAMYYAETARTERAVELTRQMLEINPNYPTAHYSLGYIYRYAGMLGESIHEMEKAVAINPKNPRFRSLGLTYLNVGEYEKAIDAFEIDKGTTYSLGWQGIILFRQGNLEKAVEYFDRVIAMEPEGLWGLISIVFKSFIHKNTEEGLHAMEKIEQADLADSEGWYLWASFYGLLGDRDGGIRCLRRAVDGGYFNYPFMRTDSFLDSMRDDPEFQEILAKAKEKHLAFRKRFFE